MATRSQKIRLGLFAAATASVLAIVLVVFAGLRVWEREAIYYVAVDGTALGLDVGARVTMNGIRIGTVEDLALVPDAPDRVRITIEVEEDTPIRTDTRAYLTYAGITGLKIIDLRGGSPGAPLLEPGGVSPTGETTLDQLQDEAAVLIERTTETMARVEQVLDNLVAITDPAQFEGIGEAVASARETARNLAAASDELQAMVSENRVALRQSIAAVGSAAEVLSETLDQQVEALAENAGGLVTDLRSVIRTNRTQLHTAVADLRQASRSFKELARELRDRPSRLLYSRPPRERELP